MILGKRKLAFLLAGLALAIISCTPEQEPGIPPCTPLEGETGDPCEGDASTVMGQFASAYSNIRTSEFIGEEPLSIRWFLEGGRGALLEGHVVVRGQFLPNTVRCTQHWGYRPQAYLTTTVRNIWVLTCYADIRALEYVVGSGPSTLTAVVARAKRDTLPADPEAERAEAEGLLAQGNLALSEGVFFLGPALETSVESWEVFEVWDLERKDDDTVIVVHPDRVYWEKEENYETAYRSKVEWTLSAFRTTTQAAHSSMLAAYDGRIDNTNEVDNLPMLVTNTNNLHSFYVETGAVDHPDGPPAPPPPACGLAVPDQASNPGLMQDCMALLAAKDTLRGTGTLNWSVDVAMADWDGITVRDGRVTDIILVSKELSGTVPAALADLTGLQYLWLNGNEITGEIPTELGNLSALVGLLLNDNRLTGPIPTEFEHLSNLEALWLDGNGLSGTLPHQLFRLRNLKKLTVSGNALTGPIPVGFGTVLDLEILWLSHNQFTGTVPIDLSNLSKLEKLTLSDNMLTGQIPAVLRFLADTLTELKMANNQLTGCIPPALNGVAINDLDDLGLPACTG